MANENLKPCPFCGSKTLFPREAYLGKITGKRWYVWCKNCGAFGGSRNTYQESIDAWNRRASMMERVSDDECIKVLEAAIGEAEYVIPENVITSAIYYIGEYQRLKIDESWDRCPERMGR